MKKGAITAILLVVLLSTNVLALGRHKDGCERERERERQRRHEGSGGDYFRDLEPRTPKQQFKSEGGQLEEWSGDEYRALRDANMAAAKITLNPRGLLLPVYKDSHGIKVVVEGSARMGLILPEGDRAIERYVYCVQKGDVIAVPRGVPTWWYNDGNERTEIIGIDDTTGGEQPGRVEPFFLAGGKDERCGGVLRGFDREILARAWDVDEQTVTRLLESQNGTAIVRVREGIEMPEVSTDHELNTFFADFVYRIERSHADVHVERGGQLHAVNRYKLPALRHLDLGLTCVKLEPNAMCAPGWSVNAHKVIYIVRGNGRIQIVRNNGEKALDTQVKEGSLIVFPRFFPAVKIAGSDGLDYLSVSTSDMPLTQFIAGRNSVYNGIPPEVVARSFNIDDDLEMKIRERRTKEAIILPARSGRERRRDEASSELLGVLGF